MFGCATFKNARIGGANLITGIILAARGNFPIKFNPSIKFDFMDGSYYKRAGLTYKERDGSHKFVLYDDRIKKLFPQDSTRVTLSQSTQDTQEESKANLSITEEEVNETISSSIVEWRQYFVNNVNSAYEDITFIRKDVHEIAKNTISLTRKPDAYFCFNFSADRLESRSRKIKVHKSPMKKFDAQLKVMKAFIASLESILRRVYANSDKLDSIPTLIKEDIKPVIQGIEEYNNSAMNNTKTSTLTKVGSPKSKLIKVMERIKIYDLDV